LVHDHPEVIPMADIAPPFMPLCQSAWSCRRTRDTLTTFRSRRTAELFSASASCFETPRLGAKSSFRL
jgi:hypothetical protein